MHVRRPGDEAKFWLRPEVVVAESFGFNAGELNALFPTVHHEALADPKGLAWTFGHSGSV